MHHCPEAIEALRHLSRSVSAGPVDVTAAKSEYCEASSVWYKSLARALTQAEAYARHDDSAPPPRRRPCTKPPEMLQVEAAMSIIDHWANVSPHPTDTWHSDTIWHRVSRSLTHIVALNDAHGFGPQPPSVDRGPPAHGPTWHEWIVAHLPHITHIATRQGMIKVGRRWVTHTMDDNTRAKLGHSLDGELRRDSSDFLDAILIPTSQVTGAADVSAPLTWTSDDSNMRTHMQLVTQRLSSDKTRTAKNGDSDSDVQTYVFTREASAFLTTYDGDWDVVRPATFDEAASRIQEANIRLRKARGALQGSIDEQPKSDWEWSPYPTAQTCANMRAIVQHARDDVGITVPPGVAAMHERVHHHKAIRSAARIMRAPPGPGTTHAAMITEMLDGKFPPIPSRGNIAPDLIPDAMRGMKEAWNMWAKSAVSELDRVLSQMHTYGTSLVQALQPKHTEDEGVRDGFAQCVRNFADVTELRSALSRMKASSTGGLCGVTREHFSNAPDHVLEWVLELTQDVFDGISPTALKLGAVTPLPKDDTRFRPITLLEPIMKLVTGTVARRLSLLLHERKLLHPHQFGFVKGGGCEAPIEIVNDMYEDALDSDRPLYGAFLDATSAFDTVQHPALQAAFAHIGAPPRFVWWVARLVGDHRRVIRTAYSLGDSASEFALESGTPQGDPLSPILWIVVVNFALTHAEQTGGRGYQIHGRHIRLLCYADDVAVFAEHWDQLQKSVQAIAIALAAIGVRLNASKSYLVRSPEAALNDADRRGRTTMSFVALDSEGTLAEQHMTSVSPEEAARYLGVWFSFCGPHGGAHGRWTTQVSKLHGMIKSFYKTCAGLSPSFSQLSEVIGNTLCRRLVFPVQGGVPIWDVFTEARCLAARWVQHSLGITARGSEWSTTDLVLTPTELGGLGVPDIMPVYVETVLSTLLAGLTSHVPAARNAYAHRLLAQAPPPRTPHRPSSGSSSDDDGPPHPQPRPERTPVATERPSTFRLRALAMHGITLHVGRGGTLPMARHTGLPRQLPLSGEGAWASPCARSGPNPPQTVHTLPQWTAAAMESMGGTACPEYLPPPSLNDYQPPSQRTGAPRKYSFLGVVFVL